jgi:peptidoglycan biosynthesis protein MviN/MurJ (putative lipid II flippase)
MGKKKGMQTITGAMMGLLVVIIILVVVVLPITISTLAASQFTGTTKTVTDLFPVLLAIVGLVLIVGYMGIHGR